jgi:hypothetical protein
MRTLALGALLALCSVLGARTARAQPIERIFAAGNEAYYRGDLAGAARQYRRLLDAGVTDPDVYFNLATAEARLSHLGQAVLYLERGLWLRPGDETAEQELAIARGALGRRRAEREGQATVQARPPLIEALVRPLSADLLAWLVLGLDVLLFALLLLRPRVRREALRLGLAISSPLIALLLLASAWALAVKGDWFTEGRAAIVLREGAELREGPDAGAQVRSSVHEGQSARLSRTEGSFVRVQLAGGDRGWMKQSDVAAIRSD